MALRTCSRPRRVSISDHSFPSSYRFLLLLLLLSVVSTPPPMHVAVMAFLSLVYLLYILALLDSALYHLSRTYLPPICLLVYDCTFVDEIQFICIYLPWVSS